MIVTRLSGRFKSLTPLLTMPQRRKYTCSDYREEMRLLGLKKRLNDENLGESEKQSIKAEIARLEKALQMN